MAKADLRNLFCKAPTWDNDLQAIVINGNRTHDPNYLTTAEFIPLHTTFSLMSLRIATTAPELSSMTPSTSSPILIQKNMRGTSPLSILLHLKHISLIRRRVAFLSLSVTLSVLLMKPQEVTSRKTMLSLLMSCLLRKSTSNSMSRLTLHTS